MDHEYMPDPRTGVCQGCKGAMGGGCRWCGHRRGDHTGRPDPAVLAHYAITNALTGEVVGSQVKWSTTACSMPHCACRTYEG